METIHLENEFIKTTVLPDLGGRIDSFLDKKTQKEWVWHPPGYKLRKRSLSLGASFDDNFEGGWEEIFPNDASAEFQGRVLVDHGEFWSQGWEVTQSSETSVTLAYECKTVPVAVKKTFNLEPHRPSMRLCYDFTNRSEEALPFLFKWHPALKVEPKDRLDLPRCEIEAVDLAFSKLIKEEGKRAYPNEIGLDEIFPEASKVQEFFYASRLERGYCGITNTRTGSSIRFEFPLEDFPYLWMFLSFGGWRNHYVAMAEPCTNMPYDLGVALQNGSCAQLPGGKSRRYQWLVRLE